MKKSNKRLKVIPRTALEQDSVRRYGDVWMPYPGIAVSRPGHDLLTPAEGNSDHLKWWPHEQIFADPATPAFLA